MFNRGFRSRKTFMGGLLAAVLLVGTGVFSTGAGAAGRTALPAQNVLGAKNPAKGTPIKVGMVTNGKTPAIDQTIETPVAQATAKWINDYNNGIGGHPIDLDICVDQDDPSKATDCANQMIRDKVAAVVIGSNGVLENVWRPLHDAGVPVFIYGASNPNVATDPTSTFVMTNGKSTLLGLPAGVAKATKAKKVSAVAIDVPAATSFFKDPGPSLYQQQGLQLELIPIAAGTADMTPQMQRLVSGNPKGVVFIIGNDAFCIAALNGLRTAAFKGTITTIPQCITDATRTAVPGDFLKGIRIGASIPVTDTKDPTMKQYFAVLDKYGVTDVDRSNINGPAMFMPLAGFDVATKDLKGEVTAQSVIAAARAMPLSTLPVAGGLHFRCNSKADTTQPAVCSNGILAAKLDSSGKPASYTPVNDTQIPD